MGKGSRQRQQQKVAGQQRRQAASPATGSAASSAAAPGAGPAGRDRSDREQAVSAVADAVSAVGGGRGDDYARALTQLASERTPQWTSDVSRYLAEVLRMAVARAWRAGWQPAELPRHIGRELTAEHAALASDVIAREMRGYPAASVDPRWAAQVAMVCPEPVDAADGDYLGAWLQRSNPVGGLRDVIATAVEILHLLQRLPVLEQLLPLPGTARPAAARHPAPGAPGRPAGPGKPAGAAGQADERMLGRIRALLAKAEATEFAEEAEALSARAQELMARYSIDRALLAAGSGGKDAPVGRRIPVDGPYEDPKTSLLQAVAVANRCRVVWSKEIGLATVIGFPTDLDSVELLFTSLLVQADAALLRPVPRRDAHGQRSRTKAFRQSFLVSYSVRIGERLAEAAEHATREAAAEQERAAGERGAGPVAGNTAAGNTAAGSTGTALVPFLAARRQAVDDAVADMFGGSLRRGRGVRVTDEEGWLHGRAAADLASLHGHTPIR